MRFQVSRHQYGYSVSLEDLAILEESDIADALEKYRALCAAVDKLPAPPLSVRRKAALEALKREVEE